MIIKVSRSLITVLLATALTATVGCSHEQTKTETAAVSDRGGLQMALITSGGQEILSVNWEISGNGVSRSGLIDVSDPAATVSTMVAGIPAGTGYTVVMTAQTTDGADCEGSATFDVEAGETTHVEVELQCRLVDPNGTVIINGDINICPTIDYMTAEPLQQAVGSAIAFQSETSDNDTAESVSVSWTAAPSGNSFDDPSAADTNFNCVLAGDFVITLTVTDDHDVTCSSTATVQVRCEPVGECGNGIPEPGEECDDGNQTSEDGCSYDDCRIEYCGDGIVQPGLGEACEPPNEGNCNSQCQTVGCGNGTVDPGEDCDDGNTTGCDGCSPICQDEGCGNGVVECGEACDDGNTVSGDGCENDCTVTPTCDDCAQGACHDYQGVDVYNACYAGTDPALCGAVVDCAVSSGCINDRTVCYCGTADPDSTCLVAGVPGYGADGPCKTQIEEASGSTQPTVIFERYVDPDYAVGDAMRLLICMESSCPQVCL